MRIKRTILIIVVPIFLIALFAVKNALECGQFKRISPVSLYRCLPR